MIRYILAIMLPRPVQSIALVALLVFSALVLAPAALGSRDAWIEVQSPNFVVISNAGEKEARKVADQFEQFREVFHSTFPKLRVDLGKPLIIFAVKNEDSLKLLLPGYWEAKGHAHPAGLYAPGEERHFVALRTNVEADNPYQIVYHEYTHAIMNLNFRDLPVWLGEGLAEFYGNSTIHDKEVEIGRLSAYHLQVLQENRLIPIEALLAADSRSPYYNEQNRVSVFYAESWAIVHYLMLDPEARKQHLLNQFLTAWEASGNQLEAARNSFGDLKKFAQAMEGYARQKTFYVGRVTTAIHGDPKSYSSREVSPAEVAAYRALFYVHTQRPNEAKASAEEALEADPKLFLAYEARGILTYTARDFAAAEADFGRAIELNSTSFVSYFFDAETQLRRGITSPEQAAKLSALLEKAIAMNPQFAAAYAALASVYSMSPETQEKAIAVGRKALDLEPGNLSYAINYGYVLLNARKTAAAKVLAERIQQAARTPGDKSGADELLLAVSNAEIRDKEIAAMAERAKHAAEEATAASAESASTVVMTANSLPGSKTEVSKGSGSGASGGAKKSNRTEYALEGIIASAECNADSSGKVTLTVNHVGMKFMYSSLNALYVVSTAKEDSGQAPACTEWKGRRVRLYFYQTKDRPYAGELNTIQFF
jgi:Tfp pilus assembly protein PilF